MQLKKAIFFFSLLALIGTARAQTGFGNGLAFDGSGQYVSITNFGNIIPTNEITVEFWADVTELNYQSAFILEPDGGTNRLNAHIDYVDGFTYWDFGDITSSGRVQATGPTNSLGKWVHFAFVASQSGNYMRIYTNGNLLVTKSGMSPFVRGNYELRIGGNVQFSFYGQIDDFRVWNTARSQAQIQANLSAPLVGNEAGLLVYYRFDSFSGNIAANSATVTGAAYNGVLVNGPSWVGGALSPVTLAATATTTNSTTLRAMVYPGPNSLGYYFEYGTTTNYGSATAIGTVGPAGNIFTPVSVSKALSGLSPTVYHFRIVTTNNAGTNAGGDLVSITSNNWTALVHPPPGAAGHFLLLSDGTVMAEDLRTDYGPGWFRLAPDIHGNYANGTWTNTAPMNFTRLDFASIVLKDGRVFVAGGEYGSGTNNAEVYDPVANTWTMTGPPPAGQVRFFDSGAVLLPNGNVLIAPVNPATFGGTVIFNPSLNTLTAGPTTVRGFDQDEASWVKLPDDSILTIDTGTTNSERYIPSSNTWINDANVPVEVYDPYGTEEGPGLLLPNGKAIFFGSTPHTAVYTPSGNNSPGSWVAGPDFPNAQGMPDAPAAMMVNGKVLCAVSPTPISANHFPSTVSFYEYDYLSNNFVQVGSPTGGTTFNDPCWPTLMLDLPDGTVMFGHRNVDFYLYHPVGDPLTAGKPTVATFTTNLDGSCHLTGTLFNGISQGASYGDDEQMDSNFPLVRFIDAAGNVRYGRTYNWSHTGVMTGNLVMGTDCTLPPGASLKDTIQVVANGTASDPFYNSGAVTTTNDSGIGSLRSLVASSSAGTTITFATNLSGKGIVMTSGELLITRNLTIDGSGLAAGITLDGNSASRVLEIAAGNTITLSTLRITNGNDLAGTGGGILNNGSLTLNQCTVAGNSASNLTVINGAGGGGIYNQSGASLTLNQCDISSNSVIGFPGRGGGIANWGQLTVNQCLVSSNSANFSGGGVFSDTPNSAVLNDSTIVGNSTAYGGGLDTFSGLMQVNQCTVAGNVGTIAGGGIYNFTPPAIMTVTNSIVGANSSPSGADIYNQSTLTFGGANVVQDIANGGTTPGTVPINANPLLAALGNNRGPTRTMPPLGGSPAIDAGNDPAASGITTDQRGLPRSAGAHVDIGAVELQATETFYNPVQTTADDGPYSLRSAIASVPAGTTITFAPGLAGQTILLTSGQLILNQNVTIDASSLNGGIFINGNHNSRIFQINGGVTVSLNLISITNGFAGPGAAGGAILNQGSLAMNNCTLSGNTTDSSAPGGAIFNTGILSLMGCTLFGNSGAGAGAIDNRSTATLRNCTLYGNSATVDNGGAIDNGNGASLSLIHCTISGNFSFGAGGGIDNYLSQLNFTNTIIAGNTGNYDIYNWSGSTLTAGGSNIVQVLVNDGTAFGTSTILASDPLLGLLTDNGGRTLTMVPRRGSTAINAGSDAALSGLTTDQRGYPRPSGAHVDIGAVEAQLASTPYLLTGLTKPENGTFQFGFSNLVGGSFTVFATTNVALPFSQWSILGSPLESPIGSGSFVFADPQATTNHLRFYRVVSP